MVPVGEMLAAAAIKEVISKLSELLKVVIQGPFKKIRSFKEDLEEMKMSLESVQAVLADAEKQSVSNNQVRQWLRRLKKAAYEIDDMFQDFLPDSPHLWKVLLSGGMATKMKDMKKELRRISEHRQNFKIEGPLYEPQQGKKNSNQETVSKIGSNLIVGRRVEKQSVINILLSSNNGVSETVIHGLPGVGKTILAKLVFNDERVQEAFPQRAWVYLHQNSDVKHISRAINSELEGGLCDFENQQSIYKHFNKVIKERCLIVLDNLWDSCLLDLQAILGSSVSFLVTSRGAIPLNKPGAILFRLEPLSDKFSLDLVKQVASSNFPNGDIPENSVAEIVKNCRGVPLALITVASSLLEPGRDDEELASDIKTKIFEPKVFGIPRIEKSLTSSYHVMTQSLKICFAYCAIFPKGCIIDREDLYHQWISLGLIQGSCDKSRRRIAEYNVRQLLDMSFLQDPGLSSVTERSSVAPAQLKMHDLVHDLAVSVLEDDLVVIDQEKTKYKFDKTRYVMVSACEKANFHKSLPAGLRALHIIDCPRQKFEWYNSSSFKCLRILDISGCCIEKVPSSVGKLTQLRYLNASGVKSKELPKAIGSLSELQYLNLHGSSILTLPESTAKLGKLMHLDLSDCVDLQTFPKSFCELGHLSLLTLKNCSQLCSLPDGLDRLKNLENLNLSGCSSLHMLPESFGELESLKQLDLSGCKKLAILPYSFVRLTCLQYLNVSSCSDLDIPVDYLNKLAKLIYVNMSSCPKLLGLPHEFCSLEHLHTLNLSDCSSLKSLPEGLGQMKRIRFILLDGCPESVRKPILKHRLGAGLQSLPAFVVEAAVDSFRSNISQLEQEKFSELELYRLEKVRTVDEAEALKMPTRSRLRSLGLMWTLNVDRFVEDEVLLQALEPPEDLQKFRVQGYMGERFPKWNVDIGSCRRGQLDEVWLMHFPMCNSLPQLGQLANLKKLHLSQMPKIRRLGAEFSDHTGALKNLEIFTLEYMENLEELCTTMPSYGGQQKQEFIFPTLQELNIYHCPRLKMQPCPPRSINWDVRASSIVMQLLLKKDEVMRSLADYMGLQCPFDYTTELHISGSSSTSPSPIDGWKFHGSVITLKDLTSDSCSLIDTLLGKGSSIQCLVYLEISGVDHTKSLQEQVEMIAYSTRSSLAKLWPDLFRLKPTIKNGASPHFVVTGYATYALGGWIDKLTSFLGNLIRINMEELPMCDRLPPLGQLPRLQELRLKGMPKIRAIDRDICGCDDSPSAVFFPRLTKFVLNGMPNLEEWVTKVSGTSDGCGLEMFMFPELVKLTIWNCPKLRLKPCPPRASELDINNSDQVIASSYDANSGSEQVTTLQVLLCKVPPNGWKLLHHLPRIQDLAIVSCHGMEALPESTRSLSSLQSLTISKCNSLRHLPEWLGDITCLEKLMVVSCPMAFLPGSLRRLSLRSLSLNCCDRMSALPGWLGDLNTLERITIEGCNSLRSLPQLPRLQELLIKYNSELEKWCETEGKQTNFARIKNKSFWLESPRGSKCCMLPARSLGILWAHDNRYWRLHSNPESRLALSMQLIEVWWLVMEGSVPSDALSADTSYEAYLVYKLADEHDGLRWGQSYVQVDGVDIDAAIVSFVDEDAVRVDGVAYPVTRSEGWMELRLGEFYYRHGHGEVKVGVREKSDAYAKKGLIVEGMEIRAKTQPGS